MSDVKDWTRVSAGTTQIVGQGSTNSVPFGPTFQWNFAVSGIPKTTRSLLILAQSDAGNANTITFSAFGVSGAQSGRQWATNNAITDDSGNVGVIPGRCVAAIYAPLYGQLDSGANISFGGDKGGKLDWTVLALPDADLLGSNPIPLAVANSNFVSSAPANPQPLIVQTATGAIALAELVDGAGNQQGTVAHPLVTESIGRSDVTWAHATGGAGSPGTATLLTVPAGNTYYLKTAAIWAISSSAFPGGDAFLFVGGSAVLGVKLATGGLPSASLSFPDGGLPLAAGTTVQVNATAGAGFVNGAITYTTSQ